MSDLKERLDNLKILIQQPDFLEGKGLRNEVNIRIFCYDPSEEMSVLHFISQIKSDKTLKCRLIECDLYEVFLSTYDKYLESILELEEEEGSASLLRKLISKDYIKKMQYSPHNTGDVLMLTGIGNVYPLIRAHSLLETLQPIFHDIPILLMYPGSFDGNHLKLFDLLQSSNYYRAFSVI